MEYTPKKISSSGDNTINAFKKVLGINVLSNVLIVDKINGNDELAVSNIAIPYKSLTAAKNGAISGNTILVLPGIYTDYDLLKDGVNWIFLTGSKIQFTTEVQISIFDDSDGAKNCIVEGNLEIDITCNSIASTDSKIINIINNSTISIKLKSFSILNSTGISDPITAIYITNGNVFWFANTATSGWIIQQMEGGNVKCNVGTINGGYGFVTENGTLICEIDIANTSDVVIYSGGTGGSLYGGIVYVKINRSLTGIVFYHNNGKVFGKINSVIGMLNSSGPNTEMFIECESLICVSGQSPLNCDGGTLHFKIKKLISDLSIISCGGGNVFIYIENCICNATEAAISVLFGGNLRLSGRYEMTGNYPLLSQNIVGKLILDSAKLITAADKSITGTSEVTSLNSFSNKPVDVGVTVNGILTVDSYVE